MNRLMLLVALLSILLCALSVPAKQDRPEQGEKGGPGWAEFQQGVMKMHAGMASIKPAGDNDVDFVNLMLPHHQAALDMAKTELAHGRDPQMRRLAQEIVTDQESEIQLMQLWLKQHPSRGE